MRHQTVRFLGMVLLIAGSASQAATLDPWGPREYPNLLYNRSFEAYPHHTRPDQPSTWQAKDGARRVTDAARTGNCSIEFRGHGHAAQIIRLLPDTEYEFRVFWKGDGRGLKIGFEVLPGKPVAEASADGSSPEWQPLALKFRTPGKLPRPLVYIAGELPEGKTAWLDDVALVPADAKLDRTPAPVVEPAGGTFEGPTYVAFKTDFPGGTVRFTIDGSQPDPFSMPADVPVCISGSCTLKAKVFHDAYCEGPTAEAKFEIRPRRPATGVPLWPIRWGQPVEEWWKEHFFNPASPNFVREIRSSEPRINVADVRDRHPESKSAGIEEALAELPAAGGTLWFPKDRGPYVIAREPQDFRDYYATDTQLALVKRSHVHLLSDGAEIRGTGPCLITVTSMEYAETKTMQRPVTDWLVRGLVFDGQGTAYGALQFYHTNDVLMEDCTFRDFVPGQKPDHVQVVLARAQCDNVWVRRCRFEQGPIGVLYDGVFNGGVLESHLGPGMKRIHVSVFPNTDMGIPPRMLCPLLRAGRYLVFAGNTHEGPERPWPGQQRAYDLVATETLVANNRAENLYAFICFKSPAMPPHNWPHRWPTGGLRVTGNTVQDARVFAIVDWSLEADPAGRGHLLEGNSGTLQDAVLEVNRLRAGEWIEGITFRGNRFRGQKQPLRIKPEMADRIRSVSIEGTLFGKE